MTGEECNCSCHRAMEGMEVRHMMACCSQCPHCHKNITHFWLDEHVANCAWSSMSVLDTELKYFEQHRMEWFESHPGKFALVKGTTLYGFFDTYEIALSAGYLVYCLTPFLIKEVQMRDKVLFMSDCIVIDLFKGIQDDYVI